MGPDGVPSLDDPRLFINRELSWLDFNRRVLEEAEDPAQPLLERVKFLAICGGNIDEFFMSRVPGLLRQAAKGALETPPDGMGPAEQLNAIRCRLDVLLEEHARVWRDQLLPGLAARGIFVHRMQELDVAQIGSLRRFFERR